MIFIVGSIDDITPFKIPEYPSLFPKSVISVINLSVIRVSLEDV